MRADAARLSGGTIDEERAERARRAVTAFRKMTPQMTGLAQAITDREDVRVQAGMGNYTDGQTIFMRPPIELGDDLRHDLRLCNAGRTPHGPICPACLSRENVIMGLYHEIAHIAFDSFAPVSDDTKLEAIDHAIRERAADDARAALIRARIESAPDYVTGNFKGLSSLVSPFLPNLVNAIEDFRVNRELTRARPGTREAFTARYRRVFAEGIETDSGDVMLWENQPANSQAVIGIFAALNGLEYDDWFSPEVVAMLHSDDVQAVLADAKKVRSAAAVYSVAFPVLEAMRKHGFCKRSDDPEPEPEEQPETDDERPEQGNPSDEESKPNPDREDKPERGEPTDGDDEDSDDDGADSDSDDSDSDGEPGAEDGDTDEPSDEDSTGESDGDPSDDDEGDGEGAGDSEDADGSEEPSTAGASPDGDAPDSDSSPDGDTDDSDTAPDSDTDGDSSAPTDDTDGDSSGAPAPGAPDGDSPDGTDGDSDDDEHPEAGTDPGESKLEEEHVDAEPQPEPYTADGEPEDAGDALDKFLGHHDHDGTPEGEQEEQRADELEVDRAIAGEAFDSGSKTVFGVRHHHFDKPYISVDGTDETFGGYYGAWSARSRYGTSASVDDLRTPEALLGPALMQMRAVFADNSKWKRQTGLRAGKVNGRTLGRRVTVGDDRLFHKRDRPGKKDYHVVIGLDISGSTRGGAIDTIKAAAFAQAELLRRAGISFEMYAHTGSYHDLNPSMLALDIYHIKDANEAWDNKTQERLAQIHGSAANLDGHTLEFYRKQLDKSTATDRIIMYYTDGAMPAENYTEELAILQREIGVCKRKGYTLMAVGVGNDDPVQYGLDTVRIDRVDEVRAVVKHLEKRLVN